MCIRDSLTPVAMTVPAPPSAAAATGPAAHLRRFTALMAGVTGLPPIQQSWVHVFPPRPGLSLPAGSRRCGQHASHVTLEAKAWAGRRQRATLDGCAGLQP